MSGIYLIQALSMTLEISIITKMTYCTFKLKYFIVEEKTARAFCIIVGIVSIAKWFLQNIMNIIIKIF